MMDKKKRVSFYTTQTDNLQVAPPGYVAIFPLYRNRNMPRKVLLVQAVNLANQTDGEQMGSDEEAFGDQEPGTGRDGGSVGTASRKERGRRTPAPPSLPHTGPLLNIKGE